MMEKLLRQFTFIHPQFVDLLNEIGWYVKTSYSVTLLFLLYYC